MLFQLHAVRPQRQPGALHVWNKAREFDFSPGLRLVPQFPGRQCWSIALATTAGERELNSDHLTQFSGGSPSP